MKTPLPLAFAVPLLAAIGLGAAGCSRNESAPPPAAAAPAAGLPRPAAGEFSVMTFNLNQYALADRDGELAAAKLMNLSISCDHRVVDGWDAASYVQLLKKYLETPVLLFAD